jgi:hypothetical protein
MPAGATYEPIATQTLSSSAASITFSSIAASYTDLKIVLVATGDAGSAPMIQFNGDSASNYSGTFIAGSGSAASSTNTGANDSRIRSGYQSVAGLSSTIPHMYTFDIFSYAGSTFKTVLTSFSEDNNGSGYVGRGVGLWRSASAVTSILVSGAGANFLTGSTFTLYGVKNA